MPWRRAARLHRSARASLAKLPPVRGWTVCYHHGAGGGAPKGERNGAYRHGLYTQEAVAERRFGREKAVERASRLLPVSRTVWLEDSVHDVPIQRPELVAKVITEQAQNGFLG